jgi:hypothetical protein
MKTRCGIARLLHSALAAALLLGGCSARQPQAVNRDASVMKEFSDRVTKYVELHKRVEAELPALKDKSNPAEIAAHKLALATAIRAARSNARPADIFFEDVRPQLLRIIRSEVRGPGGIDARETIKEGNPKLEGTATKKMQMSVNAPYPDDAPLSSVPPTLLLKLPKLPEEVDYRFVGRDLILRDVAANLIVDFMREVIPQ